MQITQPLKRHGGKHDLAKWIISLMPSRCKNPNKPDPDDPGFLHYCEPYFGGGSVLLANDPEGISEVVNDLDGDLTNFWTVLQNGPLFDLFTRLVSATPFSQNEYAAACEGLTSACEVNDYDPHGGNTVVRAAWMFIQSRQSLAGRGDCFAGITRNRTRRGMNEQVSAWLNAINGLPAVHARLMRVLVLAPQDALAVIRKEDGPRTLFYLDPPYLHETRTTTGEYKHEMLYEDHFELLNTLQHIKGRFLLSGYDSPVYEQARSACGWNRHEKQINNHAASGKKKKVMTEVVWTNY